MHRVIVDGKVRYIPVSDTVDEAAKEAERVWIVGHKASPEISNPVLGFAWDFVGVYGRQEFAMKACFSEAHFYFSMILNTGLGVSPPSPVWIKRRFEHLGEAHHGKD